MPFTAIGIGTTANDQTGDAPRTGAIKLNTMLQSLYNGVAAAEMAVPVVLTDITTQTINWTAGENFTLTFTSTGNRTLALPLNGQPGTWRRVQFTQFSGGGNVLTFASGFVAPGGIGSLFLSTAGSAVDVASIYCRTTTLFEVYLQKALA